jgi:D-arabinose 1-dehydrogenase-like Zn-dependent alcohol dehydrogenase
MVPAPMLSSEKVPWPKLGRKDAWLTIDTWGVRGTDLLILKGHWPKPLPWPLK